MSSLYDKIKNTIKYEIIKEEKNFIYPINTFLLQKGINDLKQEDTKYSLIKMIYNSFNFEYIYMCKYNKHYYIVHCDSKNNIKLYFNCYLLRNYNDIEW